MRAHPQDALKEAIQLKRKKEHLRAWEVFLSLRDALKHSAYYWSNWAHLALLMGRLDEGVGFAREALRLREDNAFARSVLAALLLRLGQDEDALEQLRVRLEGEFDAVDFKKLVKLAARCRRLERAEGIFEQWQEAMRRDPDFFLAMAEGYRGAGETERAAALYQKALEIDPDHAFARRQAIALHLERRTSAAGIRELEMMLRLPENRENVYLMDLMAKELKKEKRHAEAAEIYRKIMAIRPDDLYYRKQLGFVCSKMNNSQAVVELLVPCLEAAPDDPYLLKTLRAALKRIGRREEGLRVVDRLLSQHPDAGPLYGLRRVIEKWPSET